MNKITDTIGNKATIFILFVVAFLSLGFLEISPTSNSALTIKHCHPGDVALIHDANGTMVTTNLTLTLSDFSMLNPGTNLLTIQTVCGGITSAPVSVTLILKRTPPPPVISARRIVMISPEAPLPGGLRMTIPNSTNYDSYADYTNRLKAGMRRSQ